MGDVACTLYALFLPMGWASHLNFVFCKEKPNTILFDQCVPLYLPVLLCFFLERFHFSFSLAFLFFIQKTVFFLFLPNVSQLYCCHVHKSFTFHQIILLKDTLFWVDNEDRLCSIDPFICQIYLLHCHKRVWSIKGGVKGNWITLPIALILRFRTSVILTFG